VLQPAYDNGPLAHELAAPFYARVKGQDEVTKKQYLDMNMWLPGDILLKADKMCMAHSLELRVPFLDKKVLEFAETVPVDYRIQGTDTKIVMRHAANKTLPDEWANRPKKGFPVPIRYWLREEKYYNIVKEYFTSDYAAVFFKPDALMKLLRNYMKTCLKTAEKNRMCVRVLGDKTRLDEDIRTRIAELEEATKNNDGLHFQIAINYGGRDEIVRAVKKLSAKVQSGEVDPAGITADTLEGYLDTAGIPDPDLLIRTCNEQRISNFLLWQLAYTEFYFTDVAWPDFHKEDLIRAIEKYNGRDRRYGGVKEE